MNRISFLLAALLVTATCLPTARAQIYVNGSLTTGENDGSSWENAYRNENPPPPEPQLPPLQRAIAAAAGSGQIWVARGSYYPTTNAGATARSISFVLTGNVKIYGGFFGGEVLLSQADPVAHPTILSGEINNAQSNLDNSRRVVTTNSANINSLLDGFTIRDGFNEGVDVINYPPDGAGIAISADSKPTISRCILTHNVALNGKGAGIFIMGPGGANQDPLPENNATILDCTITGNSGREGAGFALTDSSATIERCQVTNNVATLRGGGASVDFFSAAHITDCTFLNNETILWDGPTEGGGVFCNDADAAPNFRNCQFTLNNVYGGNAGGASVRHAEPTFINCRFTGNSCTLLSATPFGLQGRGGGIWLDQGGRVIDCSLVANSVRNDVDGTPAGRGGGIFALKDVPFPIVNTEFYWNLAERGGGLHVGSLSESPADGGGASCRIHVINCSFTENTASNTGGGVQALGGEVQTFTNCIFWNNSATDSSTLNKNFHTGTGSSAAIPNHCCIEGGHGTFDLPGFVGDIFVDPKFNQLGWLESLDLRLRLDSPCIDVGNTPPVPTDQFDVNAPDGNLDEKTPDRAILRRVVDVPFIDDMGIPVAPESPEGCGVVDMGSFEAQPVCGTGVPGDMNGDGVVDSLDVSPFSDCYLNGDPYSLECACADINHDGVFNRDDSECFDSILNGYPLYCYLELACDSIIGFGMMGPQNQSQYDTSSINARIDSFEAWRTANPRSNYPTMSQSVYDAWVRNMMISMVFPEFAP